MAEYFNPEHLYDDDDVELDVIVGKSLVLLVPGLLSIRLRLKFSDLCWKVFMQLPNLPIDCLRSVRPCCLPLEAWRSSFNATIILARDLGSDGLDFVQNSFDGDLGNWGSVFRYGWHLKVRMDGAFIQVDGKACYCGSQAFGDGFGHFGKKFILTRDAKQRNDLLSVYTEGDYANGRDSGILRHFAFTNYAGFLSPLNADFPNFGRSQSAHKVAV